jgi:hypothetical protein
VSVAEKFFNSDQLDHMRSLRATAPEQLHWCGWYRNERHPYPELHPHPECPREFTAADKINMRCEVCGNEPWIENGGRLVHRGGCTPALRRGHQDGFDLGGEG